MKKFFSLVAMLTICSLTSFAQTGYRVVTGHPDFKVKIQRCAASGSTCVIDMVLTNIGSSDVEIIIYGGGDSYGLHSKAYDDEGNVYMGTIFLFGYGFNKPSNSGYTLTLPAGVPIKARIQIEGVASYATTFARIDLDFRCRGWGMNDDVKIYNVPIFREGN